MMGGNFSGSFHNSPMSFFLFALRDHLIPHDIQPSHNLPRPAQTTISASIKSRVFHFFVFFREKEPTAGTLHTAMKK